MAGKLGRRAGERENATGEKLPPKSRTFHFATTPLEVSRAHRREQVRSGGRCHDRDTGGGTRCRRHDRPQSPLALDERPAS
jgi:hypothetical protein